MGAGSRALVTWPSTRSMPVRHSFHAPKWPTVCHTDIHRQTNRQHHRRLLLPIPKLNTHQPLTSEARNVYVFQRLNQRSKVWTVMIELRFLRAIAECIARPSHRLGVCLSVCLSHSWSVSKRCKLRSRNLLDCPDDSSLSWQNFVLLSEGVSFEQGRQRGVPPYKDVILPLLALLVWKRLQIGTDMLLIITSTGHGLFNFINIDDLEWPWTTQKGILSAFSQFLNAAHISTLNSDEMAGDRPRQPAYEIFSIKRKF